MNVSDLDLGALSRALDDSDPDREHYLHRTRGALWTFVFSQATDETRQRYEEVRAGLSDGWLQVPSPSPRESYEDAEDFVERIESEEVRESLFGALERRGSLRDFREELMRHPDVSAEWLSVCRRRSRERLEAFLRTLGLSLTPESSGVES
ncbi:MAG: UPF0158 family protein [bacterium]